MVAAKRSSGAIMMCVIFALILRELQTRFGARRMGAFWMVFEPMAHVLMMVSLVSLVRDIHAPAMDYPVFLLSGVVPFFLMRNIVLKLMEAVSANQALFAYPNIKPFDTFVARAVVELALFSCVYLITLAAMGIWLDYEIAVHRPLRWMASLAVGVALSFALGMICCMAVHVMPNLKTFIKLSFMLLYLISGVVFPVWAVPAHFLPWLTWNPFVHVIDSLRASVFQHYPEVTGIGLGYAAAVSLLALWTALMLYRIQRRGLLAL
ncbi:ABC transporter permease [Allopusillimonas ginsengisoli]|uniref:ABC transporter permease n=1 Tax=Allopusillimonas ginsengisoli TaxID=453575 RepID=UPI00101FB74F|nr:ABC transporter permease [Allopusillimonas ginsengisoli]TEA78022.1 sugar ABC transporter permease [Allopusillimonas ginsengisoli]